MKKINIAVIILVLVAVIFAPNVYAGSASADKIDINAVVDVSGGMTVKEKIVWDVEDELNGVYRDVLYTSNNALNSATKMEVLGVKVDGKEYRYSKATLKNGTRGAYNVNSIENGYRIKIFNPMEDEKVECVITYKLYDVVVKYNDIAELYWNFIGNGWDYGIDSVNITISLPKETNTLKIFGHGPLYGSSKIVDTKTVALNVDGLRSREQVDARVLFDTDIVQTSKVVNEDKLASILAKEETLAIEANNKREMAKKELYVCLAVSIVSIFAPIIVYINYKKKMLKPMFDGKYYRELPEDYGPEVMNRLLNPLATVPTSNDMLAVLLNLVNKKYVVIEPITKEGKKKPADYNLKLVKEDFEELNESEIYYLRELIFMGGINEISLKELKKRNTRSTSTQNKAYVALTKWGEIVGELAIQKEVIAKNKTGIAKSILACVAWLLLSFSVVVFGIYKGYEDIIGYGFTGSFICIAIVVAVILSIVTYASRTEKGREHEAMWKAFKKFLLDFSKLDEHGYDSLVIWEHYLVYAAGLGIADKVIKQLEIVFPTQFNNVDDLYTNYVIFSMLSDKNNSFGDFKNSFSSASAAAFSSPSSNGSGGGFSGGAGGGGGGGGGGGF